MRSIELWRTSALLAALLLAGAAVAQPLRQTKGSGPGFARQAPISVDDIVARIMSFDKNKDGKITRDELPERMHHLIAQGDTNKDGALDKDEIKKLATKLATPGRFGPGVPGFGAGGGLRVGPGPGVTRAGAPGVAGARGGFRFGPGPGPGFPPGDIEGVVDDLKLPGKKKDKAMTAVKAHQENVRKLMDQARAELLRKMKEILSEEEFKDFQAALDRPRGEGVIVTPDAPPPGRR
jgi:hypothetical protein